MTDYPIMFSAPMILALDREVQQRGSGKTMTRRLAWRDKNPPGAFSAHLVPTPWQNVKVGDRLWVRENFWRFGRWIGTKKAGKVGYMFAPVMRPGGDLIFEADYDNGNPLPKGKFGQFEPAWHLRPNIFLERACSRFMLIVTGTKIERLQQITEADAMAEGVDRAAAGTEQRNVGQVTIYTFRTGFVRLWGKFHGTESWLADPEVVAISFSVHKQNIDAMKDAA